MLKTDVKAFGWEKMRKVLLSVLVIIVACVLVWAGLVYRFILHPRSDPPQHTQVIYLLGGDPGGAQEGFRLLDEGQGDILVLSSFPWEDACGLGYKGHKVLCVQPYPPTTQGEAIQLSDMAARYGWSSITVLTWPAHLARTRILMGRCYPGPLRYRATTFDVGTRGRFHEAIYESLGMVKVALSPGCTDMLPFGLSKT